MRRLAEPVVHSSSFWIQVVLGESARQKQEEVRAMRIQAAEQVSIIHSCLFAALLMRLLPKYRRICCYSVLSIPVHKCHCFLSTRFSKTFQEKIHSSVQKL